jgi:Family of unknown function (DUF695)/Regulator of ribonuclease activity B
MKTRADLPWEPDFDFYELLRDDKRALTTVDLGAAASAPLGTHPWRMQARTRMRAPQPDGLRASEEAPALFALEDTIGAWLEGTADAIQVGRMLCDGMTTFVFYLTSAGAERVKNAFEAEVAAHAAPYTLEWGVAEDADWSFYDRFLFPEIYPMQTISNRRLLAVRAEHGDRTEVVREVDHFAYFALKANAAAASGQLAGRGFRVDEPSKGDDDTWGLQFHRDERLDEDRPTEFTEEILDIVVPLDGDYDGWGAAIVSGAS